jgi:UDP-N-acetyl-D-mannosaminuronate dehydrogenase
MVRQGRQTNDGMAEVGIGRLRELLGDLRSKRVLVLGASYREDVKELAFSTAFSIVDLLHRAGAEVMIHDPLFTASELGVLEADVVALDSSEAANAEVVVVQAWHRKFHDLDWKRFKHLRAVLDGRGAINPSAVQKSGAAYVTVDG